MMQWFRRLFSYIIFTQLISLTLAAQSFTARPNTSISIESNGFYEYLPQGYDPAGTTLYPLLIASHGVGERGNGTTELDRIIQPGKGLASLLAATYNTTFPTSFTVNGNTFKFIILTPQYIDNGNTWPSTQNIDDIITYAMAHYKVDPNRIYLTGLSMGGGLSFRYVTESISNASRIAAFVPIAPAIQPGPPYSADPDPVATRNITDADLPVWGTHNLNDNVVPVSFTNNMVQYINAPPGPAVPADKTIFTNNSDPHDAWTETYDPSTIITSGMNIYEWMLQYQRSFVVLPVVLSDYRAYRSSASEVTISWTMESQVNHDHFTLERSSNGINFITLATYSSSNNRVFTVIDDHPTKGNNYYRLSQTDINGSTRQFSILKVNFDGGKKNALVLKPNPVIDFVELELGNEEKGTVSVVLVDMKGTVLKKFNYQKTSFTWNQSINLTSFPPGSYVIQVRGKDFVETKTVVKK
jgi:predicted esterase